MPHTTWTKDSALEELDRLIAEINNLRGRKANSAEHVRWHQRALTFEGTKAAGIIVTATEVRTVSISVAP
jgi:hypothetical protein